MWGLTSFESAVFEYIKNQNDTARHREVQANLERFLEPLAVHLSDRDYLLGNRFSAADIVSGYNLGLVGGYYQLSTYLAVDAYLSRLLARPAASRFVEALGA